jgi:hypothetical protein
LADHNATQNPQVSKDAGENNVQKLAEEENKN